MRNATPYATRPKRSYSAPSAASSPAPMASKSCSFDRSRTRLRSGKAANASAYSDIGAHQDLTLWNVGTALGLERDRHGIPALYRTRQWNHHAPAPKEAGGAGPPFFAHPPPAGLLRPVPGGP